MNHCLPAVKVKQVTVAFGEESSLAKLPRLMLEKNLKLGYPGLMNLKYQIFENVELTSLATAELSVA